MSNLNQALLVAEAEMLLKRHGTVELAAQHASRIRDGGVGISVRQMYNRLAAASEVRREQPLTDRVAAYLRKRSGTSLDIATALESNVTHVLSAIGELQENGFDIERVDNQFMFSKGKMFPMPHLADAIPTYLSRPDNTYVFGACGDQHLGSKYERLDINEKLYDEYEQRGVDRVFNTGNWIDGEARFNKFDLHTHGLDAQVEYMAKVYPKRDGIATYGVSGDDHEGWYTQREGVNVGRWATRAFEDAGRNDWRDLGFMEAFVRLVNYNTGKSTIMTVCHPGGGSSYALSYSIQKIIESLDSGEKPSVGLYGHYHKLWFGNIRGVWCVQTGTTQDQTPFMRKKKLEAHVGGTLVTLTQDPDTGAIPGCEVKIMRYLNKGFTNDRWSHSHSVKKGHRAQ